MTCTAYSNKLMVLLKGTCATEIREEQEYQRISLELLQPGKVNLPTLSDRESTSDKSLGFFFEFS
jgi:hypothetical protein